MSLGAMSLDLDERQRAMLKQMGVRVWWPKTEPVPATAVAPLATTKTVALKNNITENIGENNNNISINIIASHANLQRPNADFKSDNKELKIYSESDAAIDALGWPQLQQAVAGCRACGLCEGRTQTVFGVGPVQAASPQVDWLVVGEAPGENEDRVGEPFVGQAGQLLDNMLKALKLSRQQNVYISNVIKCRPPGNRNPTPDEVAQCEPYLHQQIALLRPRMILAMGKFAATSLLRASVPQVDKTPLGKLRGQRHTYTHGGLQVPVVVTYHPAYLLRSLTEKAKAWEDLCLAQAEFDKAQAA